MIPLKAITLLLPVAILASFNSFSQCGSVPISGHEQINTSHTIVNSYYPATTDVSVGAYSLTVGAMDTRGNDDVIAAGDLIVIMQMQGTDINTGNNDAYGDGINGLL